MSDEKNVLKDDDALERVPLDGLGPRSEALYQHLRREVIGQDEAAMAVARGTAMRNAEIRDPTKPIGVYLFTGPTGTGKTEMAKEVAAFLIGTAEAPVASLTTIQCGKFGESHRVSELLGSPTGYVDGEIEAELSQRKIDAPHFWRKIPPKLRILLQRTSGTKRGKAAIAREYHRHAPYDSVLLFDEIEKAHKDVGKILLHVVGDGELAMTRGGRTSFRNSIVILTSNVGGEEQQRLLTGKGHLGFSGAVDAEKEKEAIQKEIVTKTRKMIEATFPAELIGRLVKNIIVFRTLNREECRRVLRKTVNGVRRLLELRNPENPIVLECTPELEDRILDEGVSSQFGMRALDAVVDTYVRLPLASALEAKQIIAGDKLIFSLENGSLVVDRKRRKRQRIVKR